MVQADRPPRLRWRRLLGMKSGHDPSRAAVGGIGQGGGMERLAVTQVLQHLEPAARLLEAFRPVQGPAQPMVVRLARTRVAALTGRGGFGACRRHSPGTNLISNTGLQLTSQASSGAPTSGGRANCTSMVGAASAWNDADMFNMAPVDWRATT